jgi:hypothetical protein
LEVERSPHQETKSTVPGFRVKASAPAGHIYRKETMARATGSHDNSPGYLGLAMVWLIVTSGIISEWSCRALLVP